MFTPACTKSWLRAVNPTTSRYTTQVFHRSLQPVVFPVGVEEERRECPRLLAKVYLTARHIHSSFLLSIAPEQKRSRLVNKYLKMPYTLLYPFYLRKGRISWLKIKKPAQRDCKYEFIMKIVKSR
jgi:hypothetical protein